ERALCLAALIGVFIVAVLGSAALYMPSTPQQGGTGLTYWGFVTAVLLASVLVWAMLGADYLLRRKQSWRAGPEGIEVYARQALVHSFPWSDIRQVRLFPFSVAIQTRLQPRSERLYWIDPRESKCLKQLWESHSESSHSGSGRV